MEVEHGLATEASGIGCRGRRARPEGWGQGEASVLRQSFSEREVWSGARGHARGWAVGSERDG
jgi:hypothetical protein